MIDATHLSELDAVLGRETTDTLIDPMLAELGTAPVAIRHHAQGGDAAAARSAAHGLRGAALNLGCVGVADLCGRIENAAAEALPPLTEQLLPIAAQTAAQLRRFRSDSVRT